MVTKSKGFTLVELLVGLTVGTLVLGTVAAVFVPSLTTYRNNQAAATIQENERFSINALASAVDQAGFFGCDSREPASVVNAVNHSSATNIATTDWLRDFSAPVRITATGESAAGYIGGVANGNRPTVGSTPIGDVLTLLTAGLNTHVLSAHNDVAQTVTFRGNLGSILGGKQVSMNDCRNTAVFAVDNGTYDSGTNTTTFSYASAPGVDNCNSGAGAGSRVRLGSDGGTPHCGTSERRAFFGDYTFREGTNSSEMVAQSFFIASGSAGGNVNSLWTVTVDGAGGFSTTPVELVSGVDNMRVLYGIRGTSGAIVYLSASNFTGDGSENVDGVGLAETFADVISVEVTLLLNSGSNVSVRGDTTAQEFTFPTADGTAQVICNPKTGTPTVDIAACPNYLSADANSRGQVRRVVKKIFNLRNTTL